MVSMCFNTANRAPGLVADPDLTGQAAAAARAGFSYFGPDLRSVRHYCEAGRTLEELAVDVRAAGLSIFELTGLHISEDRGAAVTLAEEMADVAATLQPSFVTAVADAADDVAVDVLRRAAELLEPTGARLALEFVAQYSVGTITDARRLVATADVGAGVLVDSWHFCRGASTWEELDALPLNEIAYVHFDDALPVEGDNVEVEAMHRRALPGEGELDLDGFAGALQAKVFDGVVSLEVLSSELRALPPDEVARLEYEAAKQFWSNAKPGEKPPSIRKANRWERAQ